MSDENSFNLVHKETWDRFDQAPGFATAKRASEIALSSNGGFLITFVGSYYAEFFARIVNERDGMARHLKTCRCGNFGSPSQYCNCTAHEIRTWQERRAFVFARSAQIMIRLWYPSTAELDEWLKDGFQHGEPDEAMVERVNTAKGKPLPSDNMDEPARTFLTRMADNSPRFSYSSVIERAVFTAQHIARLADEPKITPVHLAEACQYLTDDLVLPSKGDVYELQRVH